MSLIFIVTSELERSHEIIIFMFTDTVQCCWPATGQLYTFTKHQIM